MGKVFCYIKLINTLILALHIIGGQHVSRLKDRAHQATQLIEI